MKLTIFGATGAVGREVVTQALDYGHHSCASARCCEVTRAHVPLGVL